MAEPAPQIIVIAGPNGAGKSTVAPFLLRDTFGVSEFVNADSVALGLSAFNPQGAAFEAGRIMLRRLRDLAAARTIFAFETTLSTRSYAPWLGGLKARGYNFHLLFLWLRSSELAAARVRQRVAAGGHDVPEPVVRRRYGKGVRNFFDLYRPLADSWVVYDNSVAGDPRRLAVGRGLAREFVLEDGLWDQFRESGR
jgi:predicted ABC-type ATPase